MKTRGTLCVLLALAVAGVQAASERALLEQSLKEELRDRIARTKREATLLYDAMNEQHQNLQAYERMYTEFLKVEAEWASSGATEAPTAVVLNGRRLLEEEDPDAGRISVARKQLKKATLKRNLNMLYYLWKKDAYKMMKHKYNELLKTVPFTMLASDYGDNMLVPDLWLNPDGGYLTTYAVEPSNGGSFVPVRFHQGQMGIIGAAWGLERVGPRFVRQVQKGEFVEATIKTPNCGGPRDTLRSLIWFVLSTNPNLGAMVDLQDWSSPNPTNYSDLHSHSASASVLVNDPTMVVMAAEMCTYEDDPFEGSPTNHQFKVIHSTPVDVPVDVADMASTPGQRLMHTENHVDWITVGGADRHCTSTNPGHLNVRIFVSNGMIYFDDHNCHMLTATHTLADGPYYLYVGATTEDKAFERDETEDMHADEFAGWNMLEFLTVRQESELVAAPAPNFRAPNLLTPERWYNPCAYLLTEQPELFSKVPTCFTAYLWDGVRGGVSLGSNPAFLEEQSVQTAMAKFHTTVAVDSMVSFVAKLDSSFPFVMLTQATGDNTHVTGAQTQAFPKMPEGVTGVRMGYYAESGVEYLYLATDETIVMVPVGGVAGEYVEVHVVVSVDKVSLTANVDGLNDMGAFTFSTFADSYGSMHAAHEVAHAMTGGAFDLYVGAVADELAAGNQALFLSLSVVGPVVEPTSAIDRRKLLAEEQQGARDSAAELTEAEVALNWAGPEQEATSAAAGARLLLAASWENQPKETLEGLERQLRDTEEVSDALAHQTKAQVELYNEYDRQYRAVAKQLAHGEHVALEAAYGAHSFSQTAVKRPAGSIDRRRRALLMTSAEIKKKGELLKVLETATAKRNLYALYYLWRKDLHLTIHARYTTLRTCSESPDYDLPEGSFGENLLFPQFWQMTRKDGVTYALAHSDVFVPAADSLLLQHDGSDYLATLAASQSTVWDTLNGGLRIDGSDTYYNPGARFYRRVPAGAEVHVTWRDTAACAEHVVMMSTNPSPGAFEWETKSDAVTFVWNCATKSIYTTSGVEDAVTTVDSDATAPAAQQEGEYTVVLQVGRQVARIRDTLSGSLSMEHGMSHGPYYLFVGGAEHPDGFEYGNGSDEAQLVTLTIPETSQADYIWPMMPTTPDRRRSLLGWSDDKEELEDTIQQTEKESHALFKQMKQQHDLWKHYLHKYRALHSHLEGAAVLTDKFIDRRRGRALLASPREILLKRELAEVTAERNQNLLYYLWKKDAASHMEDVYEEAIGSSGFLEAPTMQARRAMIDVSYSSFTFMPQFGPARGAVNPSTIVGYKVVKTPFQFRPWQWHSDDGMAPSQKVFPYPVTSGAHRIVMGDDDHAVVALSEPFQLYDEQFDYTFLSSNGFLTFSNGISIDDEYWSNEDYNTVVGGYGTEATLKYHFKAKRISFFLQDLNPGVDFQNVVGRRRLSQTADPADSTEIYHETINAGTDDVVEVFTFLRVYRYQVQSTFATHSHPGDADSNFQVMLYPRTGEIRFTYLDVDAAGDTFILGLSPGYWPCSYKSLDFGRYATKTRDLPDMPDAPIIDK